MAKAELAANIEKAMDKLWYDIRMTRFDENYKEWSQMLSDEGNFIPKQILPNIKLA